MFIIKKLVSGFLNPIPIPIPIIILILLIGIFFIWFTRKQKTGKLIVTLGFVCLIFVSFGYFANLLIFPLEQIYSKYTPSSNDAVKYVVVLGLEEDAEPVFADTVKAEFAGVFLAVALLSKDIFFDETVKVYKTMGAAFYGLRNTFMMLFLMAFLRIKNPEQSGGLNVLILGRLLGLDRAPSVKTIRRKIKFLCYRNKALQLMHLLGKERINALNDPSAVLYVDGHVISYYGKKKFGKTFSTSKNKVSAASTEYWVNLADGTPLLCIPTEFNASMTSVFPEIVENARKICGDRRITFVFDRGGCSGALFERIISMGCDFITYNKNSEKVDDSKFIKEKTIINKVEYEYKPYSHEIEKIVYKRSKKGRYSKTGRTVKLREVIVKRNDGGQTSIVTSRRDLSDVAVAEIIFNRWTQENYFKYLKSEYALDHLCTFRTMQVEEQIDHPNPEYTSLKKLTTNFH